ncbi:unnamed protein product [Leptidea sinapis]|uniref:Kazal-like domain-containing protein n=1 Tax=Leptidea sinapis TaxID=189913 RepID=A0A5E4QCC7_9NEOP|nr:unnamed protein product [Leptidea sinapis]
MQTHFAVATIGLFCLISSTTSQKTARSEFSDVASIINKYWCWRAKHCTNTGTVVCGRDLRNKARKYFVNTCAMYKVNCLRRYGFTATNMSRCIEY